MNIADPMIEAFKESELIAYVETESKIARVVEDSRDDAAIRNRARMLGINAFCRARQIDIMLGRPLTRKDIGPRASVGEGAELGVDGDQGIDTSFDFRFQLLIRDLTDDAMPKIAPSKSGDCIVVARRNTARKTRCRIKPAFWSWTWLWLAALH